MERYGSDDKDEAALTASCWPSGLACAACGCGHSSWFRREGRLYFQCAACRQQSGVTGRTIFEATRLGLSRRFPAAHLLTQSKNDVAALELMRPRVLAARPTGSAIDTLPGNLERLLSGICHAFDFARHTHRHLDEAQYRFNGRFNLRSTLPRLLRAARLSIQTPAHFIHAAEGCRSSSVR